MAWSERIHHSSDLLAGQAGIRNVHNLLLSEYVDQGVVVYSEGEVLHAKEIKSTFIQAPGTGKTLTFYW